MKPTKIPGLLYLIASACLALSTLVMAFVTYYARPIGGMAFGLSLLATVLMALLATILGEHAAVLRLKEELVRNRKIPLDD